MCVRKYRAPNGALRPSIHLTGELTIRCSQKAASAKRCIKTPGYGSTDAYCPGEVRKQRAPKGALRRVGPRTGVRGVDVKSESTERQKVY